jgi:hypothetical protein
MTISIRHVWKLYMQFHSHCSRIYDIKTLSSKHKTNCKCITLHTNTTIYRTQLCNTVSVQKHYCQLYNSQCKNTSIICATVNTRTLLSAVQHSVSTRTLQSAVQVSMQEHYCQLCNTESMQEHYFQLCNSQCKNTSISSASVTTRTLLSAVQ